MVTLRESLCLGTICSAGFVGRDGGALVRAVLLGRMFLICGYYGTIRCYFSIV